LARYELSRKMLLFSLDPDATLAQALAAALGVTLAPHEERHFEDGECKLRPLLDPRGSDAYVVHSLYGDAHKTARTTNCANC